MITGKEVIKVQGPTSSDQQAHECDIAIVLDKLTADAMVWLDYRRAQQAWESNARAAKRLDGKKQEAAIMEVVEDFCSTWAPVAQTTEDAVIPVVCESITTLVEKASLSKEDVYAIFIVLFDFLDHTFHTNMLPALRLISDFVSNNPEKSGAIVIAPITGKYDAYTIRRQSMQQSKRFEDSLQARSRFFSGSAWNACFG